MSYDYHTRKRALLMDGSDQLTLRESFALVEDWEQIVGALNLQIALEGDMAAADRYAKRMLDLERRFDAWKLTKQIAACMRWPA